MDLEVGDVIVENDRDSPSVWIVTKRRDPRGALMVKAFNAAAKREAREWARSKSVVALKEAEDRHWSFAALVCVRDPVHEIKLWAKERRARGH